MQKFKVYGHQMQSLDYKVIEKVREYDRIFLSTLFFPIILFFLERLRQATQWSTLLWMNILSRNYGILSKKLYVWTINSSESFNKSFHLGVDGMITDDLERIKEELVTAQEDPEYSDLLLNKATEFFAYNIN